MTLYERIQLCAKNEKVSIPTIEKECGLGNGTIGKWKDSVPKADKLYAVAKFLNKTVEFFLTGEEAKCGNNNHNILTNSINESPNSVLYINDHTFALSKQELELIIKYREMNIKEQADLINYLLESKSDKSE